MAPLEIPSRAVTQLGYTRGSYRRRPYVGGLPGTELFALVDLLTPHRVTTWHVVSIEFRDSTGANGSVMLVRDNQVIVPSGFERGWKAQNGTKYGESRHLIEGDCPNGDRPVANPTRGR